MKVAFIHGRPGPHPFHRKLAASVNADFYFVDEKLRWHDNNAFFLKRYLSWIINALCFPLFRYDIILSEGVHFTPALMKLFKRLSKTKTLAILDNEFLYFMKKGRYSSTTERLNKIVLNSYDGLICSGEMETILARELLPHASITTFFNGIEEERLKILLSLQPAIDSKNLIFIGNGPSGWRGWYKGIDLLFQAFEQLDNTYTLTIVGSWDFDFLKSIKMQYAPVSGDRIKHVGQVKDIETYLEKAALCIHPGRGEAYGISILECMAAGVVSMVSEWTGAKEVVNKVSKDFIFPLSATAITKKIEAFFLLPPDSKKQYSTKCKELTSALSESAAIANFKEKFYTLLNQLKDENK